MRARLAGVPLALALAWSQPAHAGTRDRCLAASMAGQTLMLKDQLHAARDKLRVCAKPVCPRLVRRDCVDFLGKIETNMPTIVLGARDGRGKDLVDVRVTLDGAPLVDHLDGKPVEIDPGTHALHFETEGAPPVDQTLLVREGEKDRLVTVTLGPPPPPPPTETVVRTTGPSVWTWIVGGVGLATLGATVVSGSVSLAQYQSLHDGCALTHSCAPGDVSTVNTLYDVAYATAAIGGALVVAGIVMFFTTRHTHLETVVKQAIFAPTLGGGSFAIRF